jgi:hypothetical protein
MAGCNPLQARRFLPEGGAADLFRLEKCKMSLTGKAKTGAARKSLAAHGFCEIDKIVLNQSV